MTAHKSKSIKILHNLKHFDAEIEINNSDFLTRSVQIALHLPRVRF